MKKIVKTEIGDSHDNLEVISEEFYKIMSGRKVRYIKVKCKCGKEFDVRPWYYINNRSCGCLTKRKDYDWISPLRKHELNKDGNKKCGKCHQTKTIDNFYKSKRCKDGLLTTCKKCHNIDQLIIKYKIKREDLERLILKSNDLCQCCNKKMNGDFHLDHCHKTDKVRGLVCLGCNVGIGLLKDDREIILSALNYLKTFEDRNNHKN